jgi:GDP-4-dehydro-6-deoxy-D-mannose reductase
LHLAAQSFVPTAIAQPLTTYEVNVMGSVRLAQALRAQPQSVRLLYISSAEVYGFQARHTLPLSEAALAQPANPYAASKIAAEYLLTALRNDGLQVVIARPFNHIGAGQDPRFVVAGFARQLADILAGGPNELSVGNLEAERDFLDVLDVARAYVALMESGQDGVIYNIASGTPVAIKDILRRLIIMANVAVAVREDPARMRPSDIPCFYGDASRLRAATDWQPAIALDESLRFILDAACELTAAG